MDRPEKWPTWATDGGADIVEPSEPEKELGWESGNAPPASFFNYWQNLLHRWIVNLDERDVADLFTNAVGETVPLCDSLQAVDIVTPKPVAINDPGDVPHYAYAAACGPDGSDQVLAIRYSPGKWDTYSVTTGEAYRDVACAKPTAAANNRMIVLAAGDDGRWARWNYVTGAQATASTMDGENPDIVQVIHEPVNDVWWAIGTGVYTLPTMGSSWTERDITSSVYTHVLALPSGRVLLYFPGNNTVYYADTPASSFVAGAVLASDPDPVTRFAYDEFSDKVIVNKGTEIVVLSGDGTSVLFTSSGLGNASGMLWPVEARGRAYLLNEGISGTAAYCDYKTQEFSHLSANWRQWPSLLLTSGTFDAKPRGSYGAIIARDVDAGKVLIYGTRLGGV